MRCTSTRESLQAGEVSILAIVETLLAMALAAYITIQLGTLKPLAIGCCMAPILLLRTDHSVLAGVLFVEKVATGVARLLGHERLPSIVRGPLGFSILLVGAPFILLGIRAAATVFGLVLHPIDSIKAIPKNWRRTTLSVDAFAHPEVLPPTTYFEANAGGTQFELIGGQVWEFARKTASPVRRLMMLVMLVIWFLPAYLYRWALKSTSLIYTPLLWVVWSTFKKIQSLEARVEWIRKSDVSRVLTFYSAIVLGAFLLKLVLMTATASFAEFWNSTDAARFAAIYVAPQEIPIWQFVAAVNSLSALVVFFLASEAWLRIAQRTPWPNVYVENAIRTMTFVRSIFSLYTIACVLYITVQHASDWNLPRLGTRLFPWS